MWCKLTIYFALVLGVYGVSFEYNQLSRALDNTVACLEVFYNLSSNATYALAYGLTRLAYIPFAVPNLDSSIKTSLQKQEEIIDPFFQRALLNYPNLLDAQILWYPQYWSFTGDFRFKRNNIPKDLPPLNASISEIYAVSAFTKEGADCYIDMIAKNGRSDTLRECVIPCEEGTYDTNFEGGIMSPEQRWILVGAEYLLNCTNHGDEVRMDQFKIICTYMKRQLDALYKMKDEEQFQGVRYFFLVKIMECASIGFSEFLTDDYLTYVYGSIGCDGCVGSKGDSPDVIQVLTAETAAILSQTLGLILEEGNGLPPAT